MSLGFFLTKKAKTKTSNSKKIYIHLKDNIQLIKRKTN